VWWCSVRRCARAGRSWPPRSACCLSRAARARASSWKSRRRGCRPTRRARPRRPLRLTQSLTQKARHAMQLARMPNAAAQRCTGVGSPGRHAHCLFRLVLIPCECGRGAWAAQSSRLMREFRGNEPVFGLLESEEKTPPFELEMMEAALVVATGAVPDQAGHRPLHLRNTAHWAGCAAPGAGRAPWRSAGCMVRAGGGRRLSVLSAAARSCRAGPHNGGHAGRSDSRGSRLLESALQDARAVAAPQGAWTPSCSRSASAWARCCSGCRATSRPSTWRSCAASSSRWSSWSPRPTRCGAPPYPIPPGSLMPYTVWRIHTLYRLARPTLYCPARACRLEPVLCRGARRRLCLSWPYQAGMLWRDG